MKNLLFLLIFFFTNCFAQIWQMKQISDDETYSNSKVQINEKSVSIAIWSSDTTIFESQSFDG